ncbi:unnamed protein product [Miscanthus lutarioriparius]|uniref:Uncharacterized protein n=1 Tax=Miscanthus lutarioriparius TaxID=422564 RepID=A0A811M931_9POAL|nr:unnamed protein product [Miscanthus lutarioriparius]
MGEMVVAGYGMDKALRASVSFDTPCGALLRELEQIWTEIGEREQDKDRMFLELETECMRVYRRSAWDGFCKDCKEVHPSLHGANSENSTNISDRTLEGLTQTILKLKAEKKTRVLKLQETVEKLHKLWNLMESTEQERINFSEVAAVLGSTEEEINSPGILLKRKSKRLTIQKASRMKELVLKKRFSGSCELLSSIEVQITKANEESLTRKDIMGEWINGYQLVMKRLGLRNITKDDNRYSAGRGAHLNLKRAEKARITVQKIPRILNLHVKVRLVAILEEQKLRRAQREEDKRRYRDQKKLQSLLLKEKELIFGSKPSPKKTSSFNRRTSNHHPNSNGAGFMTPVPRRVSAGSATPELLTPRSYSGRYNYYFKENRRLTTAPLNFSVGSKEDSMSSFASISGSEPDSPLFLH